MLLNMVMFKVTICDFGKMNINMTDKIEKKRRAANCVYHIGASIKDLGKKLFGFSKMEIWRYIVLRRIASKRPLLFDPK